MNMKKIFGCILVCTPILYVLAVMPLFFTSCERVNENYLQGKWQVVEATTNKYEDGRLDYSYYETHRHWHESYRVHVQFLDDNTYKGNLYRSGSYTLNEAGDKLTLTPNDAALQPLVLDVTRISNKEFEVRVSLEEGMGGYNGWGFDIVGVPILPVEVIQRFEKID